MPVAKRAEVLVKRYFKETQGVDLVKSNGKERGFDSRDKDSTVFVRIKNRVWSVGKR